MSATVPILWRRNVYCAQEHFPDGKSEMCTVHRDTFQTVNQKCVLCTGPNSRWYIRNVYCAQDQFPDGTSEMFTVHRTIFQTVHQKSVLCTGPLSRRYIRNVYCAQDHFPDGTSEMCTVHRTTLQTLHQKCIMCTGPLSTATGHIEHCAVFLRPSAKLTAEKIPRLLWLHWQDILQNIPTVETANTLCLCFVFRYSMQYSATWNVLMVQVMYRLCHVQNACHFSQASL